MAHLRIRPGTTGLVLIFVLAWALTTYAQELGTLMAGDGATNHRLGFAVAIDADVVVVGAPAANAGKGAAYIFVQPPGGWATTATPTATLTDINGASNDQFGFAVAISGDTIVIGAPTRRVGGRPAQGEAAVFVKPGGGWADSASPTAKLSSIDGAANDQFGFAVAIDAGTIVIGTPSGNMNKGAAHIFVKPGGGWVTTANPTATLTDSDSAINDQFGTSVAIDGDSVVAGAYAHNIASRTDQGATYVFAKPGGGWMTTDTPTAKLTASDGKASDQFGNAVAIDGSAIVIGAWLKDVGARTNQGAAYLFLQPMGGWSSMTESAILLASDGRNSDTFGVWVDIKGNKIVAGANLDDDGTNRNEGSVYVFAKPIPGWTAMTETSRLNASQGRGGDTFGFATAINGDIVIVGAPNDDVGSNSQQGSVSVFDVATLSPAVGALLPTAEIGALYNASLAISGGLPPFLVSDNGSLPPGLSVDNNGVVSGTPAPNAKTASVTFVVTDQNAAMATQTTKLNIVNSVTMTTKSLRRGRVGKSYRAPLRARAGKAPYTWSITAGALPSGLSIDDDIDAITGAPSTAAGSPFNFTIKVTDSLGGVVTKALSIMVSP
ncbi:MAG: putative Ig domain-containing protein [Candidatus Binatia bacterium]